MRATTKRAVGRLIGPARAERLSLAAHDTWSRLDYSLRPCGRASAARLAALRGTRSGRCFVIGNGPSLQRQDLSVLRDEVTFALNRGYLLAASIGAEPTYLVSVNAHVLEQFGSEILATPATKFVSWGARGDIPCRDDVIFLRRRLQPRFARDIGREGAWEGATVTFVALQVAFHLGFTEVILLGVDHSFSTSGPANALVTSSGDDPNHFDPSYFGKGVRWQLPDLATSEVAYRIARDAYDAEGRKIVNATDGGALEVFPRVSLDACVEKR